MKQFKQDFSFITETLRKGGGCSLATFFLLLNCVQLVGIEGWYTSWDKPIFMGLAIILLITYSKKNYEVIAFCLLYLSMLLFSAFVIQNGYFSSRSICYTVAYLGTYCYYCSLIFNKAFSYEYFKCLTRVLLFLFCLAIPFQQICAIAGIHLEILNCHGFKWGWKFPSLLLEPSQASRVMMVLFFVYFELLAIKQHDIWNIENMWKQEKHLIYIFLYAMFTMGSTTAIACVLLLGLKVLKNTNLTNFILAIVICLISYYFIKDTEAFNRLVVTLQATATFDEQAVREADTSGAARVNILLGIIHNFNPFEYGFWVGYGLLADHANAGILLYYGALAFLAQMAFLFRYAFRSIFSWEFVMFAIFLWLTLGNVAYAWGCVMLWTTLKHFNKELV